MMDIKEVQPQRFTSFLIKRLHVKNSLVKKFSKEIRFLLCVINIYREYAWVIPLKDKKGITITNAPQKILDESGRKPN